MKFTNIICFTFLILIVQSNAQRSDPDNYQTDGGDLIVQPILHGTLVLTWDSKTIFVDPYGGASAFSGISDPDLILITDIHGDHLNKSTLETLNLENTRLIVPQAVADQLGDGYSEKLVVLGNGENTMQMNIPIMAIPMYNLPETEDSRHPKGRGNGYVLNLGGKRVYISGDTEDIPEMRALKDIDIAFLCMNLPFTMDIDQAANAVLEFKPKTVYPYHFRGRDGLNDVEAFKKKVNSGDSGIDVKLRNWYPEYGN